MESSTFSECEERAGWTDFAGLNVSIIVGDDVVNRSDIGEANSTSRPDSKRAS